MFHRLYDDGVDVFTDVVTTVRNGRPHAARTEWARPFGVRHDAFDGAGFHIVLRGSCCVVPSNGVPADLGPGDVVFMPGGAAHVVADSRFTAATGAPAAALPVVKPGRDAAGAVIMLCGAYLLDRSRAHPLLAELPEIVHLPTRTGRHPALRAVTDLLAAELEQHRPGSDAAVPALLDLLLIYLLQAWFDEPTDHRDHRWSAALRDTAVAAALRAIHNDPARQWTVEELGAQGRLSRAAFARRFSALVGQPPLTYLAWWRMILAAKYLRDTDAPLGTIARRVGYGSQYAFAHAFKREYGVPPGAFRNKSPTTAQL
jgi:AraC-like DNA-binding protein